MAHNIAIIGAGLIGGKRASALQKFENCSLVSIVDININAAQRLAKEFGGDVETDWQKVVNRADVDVVIVSTFNKHLMPISVQALNNGKHVLCEKPLGRNSEESKIMVESANKNHVVLKTGFNHRHHPAITKAKKLLDEGKIGEILFLRSRYGHGGRPGYEKEWRGSRDLCGGGELLDQGAHVVDLFRWFADDFDEVFGYTLNCFWNMEVEDNVFAIFRKNNGVTAAMHTSWTQWKNLFSFEIFGHDGYLIIEGLGGSYGTETLRIGKRRPEGGPPEEQTLEFPGQDVSWQQEWKEFITAIENKREPIGNGWDGYQANIMIEAIYNSAKMGQVVKL